MNGKFPRGMALVQGVDGNFYGTTQYGGANCNNGNRTGCGVVFKVSPTGKVTRLYSFCSLANCADGYYPLASLVQANGKLHGTTTLRQVRALPTGDAVCAKCHADKAGPFVYEHVPVKTEGCSSCHTPHGSTNPRYLRVSQVNLLCLQCHSFPAQGPAGPGHNQSTKYQACTMCHAAIHGSNASDVFFR